MTAPLTRHAVWRHTGLLAAKRDPNLTEVVRARRESGIPELLLRALPGARGRGPGPVICGKSRTAVPMSVPPFLTVTVARRLWKGPRCAVFAELSDAQKEGSLRIAVLGCRLYGTIFCLHPKAPFGRLRSL